MKRRIINTVVALMAMATAGNAQQLSVGTIEAVAGKQTEITVSLTGATGKTALQYNLSLPAGLTLAETTGDYGIKLGNATKGHTLSVSPLASGDLLIVLYSMYQDTFADGTLMTIPVVASSENGTTSGTLNTIRTATADAVSSECADVAFSATATVGNAQQLSVSEVKAEAGAQSEITVNLTGATDKTALQYNLSLPVGLALAESTGDYGIKLGNATKGHTLSVSPLASGDLLIVLYSMYQDTFADGMLMTIPVVATGETGTTSGTLNTIRTATADAVSSECADVAFSASVGQKWETTVSAAGYSTLYLGQAVTVPTGVTAYYATLNDAKTQLNLIKITDGVIPANTAVILKATGGDYVLDVTTTDVTYPDNVLDGSTKDQATADVAGSTNTVYVLGYENEKVAFYRYTGETLGHHKAYLVIEGASALPAIRFSEEMEDEEDGMQTGLEQVGADAKVVRGIYNMQGQKLNGVGEPGLYIVNGKKVLVK